MRILVPSDLHFEFGDSYQVPHGLAVDVVVLAGDISCPGREAIKWARELRSELAQMKADAHDSKVHKR